MKYGEMGKTDVVVRLMLLGFGEGFIIIGTYLCIQGVKAIIA